MRNRKLEIRVIHNNAVPLDPSKLWLFVDLWLANCYSPDPNIVTFHHNLRGLR